MQSLSLICFTNNKLILGSFNEKKGPIVAKLHYFCQISAHFRNLRWTLPYKKKIHVSTTHLKFSLCNLACDLTLLMSNLVKQDIFHRAVSMWLMEMVGHIWPQSHNHYLARLLRQDNGQSEVLSQSCDNSLWRVYNIRKRYTNRHLDIFSHNPLHCWHHI